MSRLISRLMSQISLIFVLLVLHSQAGVINLRTQNLPQEPHDIPQPNYNDFVNSFRKLKGLLGTASETISFVAGTVPKDKIKDIVSNEMLLLRNNIDEIYQKAKEIYNLGKFKLVANETLWILVKDIELDHLMAKVRINEMIRFNQTADKINEKAKETANVALVSAPVPPAAAQPPIASQTPSQISDNEPSGAAKSQTSSTSTNRNAPATNSVITLPAVTLPPMNVPVMTKPNRSSSAPEYIEIYSQMQKSLLSIEARINDLLFGKKAPMALEDNVAMQNIMRELSIFGSQMSSIRKSIDQNIYLRPQEREDLKDTELELANKVEQNLKKIISATNAARTTPPQMDARIYVIPAQLPISQAAQPTSDANTDDDGR